jgi:hypothetical protein
MNGTLNICYDLNENVKEKKFFLTGRRVILFDVLTNWKRPIECCATERSGADGLGTVQRKRTHALELSDKPNNWTDAF